MNGTDVHSCPQCMPFTGKDISRCHAPCAALFSRNAARGTTLEQRDLERMRPRWEAPLPWEVHEVRYEVEPAAGSR